MLNFENDKIKKYNIINIILALFIFSIPMKNAIYQGSVILLILLFVYHIVKFEQYNVLKDLLFKFRLILLSFSGLVVSMFISSYFAVNSEYSFYITLKFIYRYLLLFVVLLYFYKQEYFTRKFIVYTILISMLIFLFDGMYQYLTGINLINNHGLQYGGITGPFFNRIIYGYTITIGTVTLLYILTERKINHKYINIFMIIILFIMMFSLFNSLSRNAWIMFAIFVFIYMLISNKLFDLKSIVIIGFCLLFIYYIMNNSDLLSSRLDTLLNMYSSSRFNMWIDSVSYIKSSYLVGYGIDTYMLVIPDNGHVALHNFFLEILLYLGLIGILAYAYFLFNILKEAILLSNKFYFAFVVSLLVWLCFDGGLISSKINLSTLVVVMFMIYSYKIRKEEY